MPNLIVKLFVPVKRAHLQSQAGKRGGKMITVRASDFPAVKTHGEHPA